MNKKQDFEYLDEKFPKGKSKLRGEAMVLLALSRQEREKEILDMVINSVKKCYADFKWSIVHRKEFAEGFRNRLDELIFMYLRIKNITFIDACLELMVNHGDLNREELKQKTKERK